MTSATRDVWSAATEEVIGRLRRQLRAVETTTGLGHGGTPLTLGVTAIDTVLGGGLSGGALHEIAAGCEIQIPAATGFALALAGRTDHSGGLTGEIRSRPGKHVLWITEDLLLTENGAPYGPGLVEAGILPERLITVATTRRQDLLWVMEEALRCRSIGVVIGETRKRGIEQSASRRLSHAAATGGTVGLILRTAPNDEPSAAATRWIIGPAPRFEPRGELRAIGPPRLALRLVRNRRGHLGAWIVEWSSAEQRFELAAHPEPVAGAIYDRSRGTAVA
jgi:protein ImuA